MFIFPLNIYPQYKHVLKDVVYQGKEICGSPVFYIVAYSHRALWEEIYFLHCLVCCLELMFNFPFVRLIGIPSLDNRGVCLL